MIGKKNGKGLLKRGVNRGRKIWDGEFELDFNSRFGWRRSPCTSHPASPLKRCKQRSRNLHCVLPQRL